MCARYVLDKDIDIVEKRFMGGARGKLVFEKRYNVAPSQTMPVVTGTDLVLLPWGFAPAWADKKVINARLESVDEKPYFREARHCLVPATGFYEWKREGEVKIPYFFHLPGNELFAFAGVCNENGYAIVTTDANESMQGVHDRMPAILTRDEEQQWLTEMITPTGIQLKTHPVSSAVNSPRNDSSNLILPEVES
jgi:putative SOS response-associated peptidase YedK